MEKDYSEVIENPMFSDAREICEEVLGKYASGEIGEIYLAYTYFKNTVVQSQTSEAASGGGRMKQI